MNTPRFSERLGYSGDEPPITVREDAPHELRGVLVDLAYESDLTPHTLRSIVCAALRVREDPGNWSAFPNVDGEVRDRLDSCQWYDVYDIIESIDRTLRVRSERTGDDGARARFESSLNDYFRRRGIGWQLVDGQIQMRGSEEFEQVVRDVRRDLQESDRPTAANEIHEALRDLSHRPTPDVTGAIQHALAALECVARDVTGEAGATLGAILRRYPDLLPRPLDGAVERIWGFASEQGRHLREGRVPSVADAELAVVTAAAAARYLVARLRQTNEAE